jgi:hypothetical protein
MSEIITVGLDLAKKLLNPFSSDLCGEQRPKAIPPKSHSLMTDFDPALMQKILNIPERQGDLDVQHHRKADDVGTGLEISKWAVFDHAEKLNHRPALHNRVCLRENRQQRCKPTDDCPKLSIKAHLLGCRSGVL